MIKRNEDMTIYEFSLPARLPAPTRSDNSAVINGLRSDLDEAVEVINYLLRLERERQNNKK